MSSPPVEPLDPEALQRVHDLLYADIENLPANYDRRKVWATYHRIMNLLWSRGEQTPQVEADEIEDMKLYRTNGFSYHDIAFILRRSPASVHLALKDMILGEAIDRL